MPKKKQKATQDTRIPMVECPETPFDKLPKDIQDRMLGKTKKVIRIKKPKATQDTRIPLFELNDEE